jgi:hypothetical protein
MKAYAAIAMLSRVVPANPVTGASMAVFSAWLVYSSGNPTVCRASGGR